MRDTTYCRLNKLTQNQQFPPDISPEKIPTHLWRFCKTLGFMFLTFPASQCAQAFSEQVTPYHTKHTTFYPTQELARAACSGFSLDYGYSGDKYCYQANNEPLWSAGWLKVEDPDNPNLSETHFHLGLFYYGTPGFFLLPSPGLNPFGCTDAEGNPCSPATGFKFQFETDYKKGVPGGLIVQRLYSSDLSGVQQFAEGWRHTYSAAMDSVPYVTSWRSTVPPDFNQAPSRIYYSPREACLQGWVDISPRMLRGILDKVHAVYEGGSLCTLYLDDRPVFMLTIYKDQGVSASDESVLDLPSHWHTLTRPDGQIHYFTFHDGHWTDRFDPGVRLQKVPDGWLYTGRQDQEEYYNELGQLLRIVARGGLITTLDYDITVLEGGDGRPKTLDRVTGPFGRHFDFQYDENETLTGIMTPDGLVQYSYDDRSNLIEVIYPDDSHRHYHYEDNRFPHHLTGLRDEKGNHYARWAYDPKGRAMLSEHAGGVEKVTFTYHQNGKTTVTDALGAVRDYEFVMAGGNLKVKNIEGDPCLACINGYMKQRRYDSRGLLIEFRDWNGYQSRIEYDNRGLPSCRIEAYGRTETRMLTIKWHSMYRMPVSVDYYAPNSAQNDISPADCAAAEQKWTLLGQATYQYDAEGRLIRQHFLSP